MAADYLMTADLLATHGIAKPVAEIHGVLCGQISAGAAEYDCDLSQTILDFNGDIEEVITNLLKMLAVDIRDQLSAENYAFQPLLPGDEEPLEQRLDALAVWCDGFNAGFAGAWIKQEADMLEETREVLNDFSRIAEVDGEDTGASDKESEVNYMEIVEYARMAAITVYLQNAPAGGPKIDGPGTAMADHEIH